MHKNWQRVSSALSGCLIQEEIVRGSVLKVIFNRGFLTLFLCYSLACTCFAFVNVGLLLHTTEDFGMDAVVVGSVIGSVSLIGLCMRPISAILVDSLNRKRMLMLAFALESVSTFGFAFADQYYLLYLLQIVRGIAWGLINCTGIVLVVDIVGHDNIGMASGVYAIGMTIGSSIAAAVVASLGDAIGFIFTFVIASGLTAAATLFAATLPLKKRSHAKRDGSILDKVKALRLHNFFSVECAPIMVLSFVFQICATALGATFLVAYGRVDLGIANVGIAATIYNVMMYFTRPLYGRIIDKYGARWCVIPAFIGFIAANLIAANSVDTVGLYVAAVVYGACSGGYTIAPRTMAIRRLGKNHEAVATSTSGIGNDVGMFLGNILVPAIAAASGGLYRNAFVVLAVVAAFGLAYCAVYVRFYIKRHPENKMHW